MKKFLSILLVTVLLAGGFCVLMYPTFSNLWNEHRQELLVSSYREEAAQISDSLYDTMLAAAEAYNAEHKNDTLPDAFAVGELNADEVYDALLNLNGDGLMGYVEVPCINVSLPVYHTTTSEVLAKGVGHLTGSSLPVGGESTHTILSAHRGLPSSRLFTDLDRVQIGDIFYIHTAGRTLAYEVDQIKVCEPDDVSELQITEGMDLATLLTCTPYGVNTQRLLVRGHRVEYSEEVYQQQTETNRAAVSRQFILYPCIGLLVVAIGAALMLHKSKKAKTLPQAGLPTADPAAQTDQPETEKDSADGNGGEKT